jgi:hypothetical protein
MVHILSGPWAENGESQYCMWAGQFMLSGSIPNGDQLVVIQAEQET